MEYSNAHHINIIPKSNFEELTQEVFSVIATNISKSLGPLGSSATIFDGSIVEATKDGYSILKKYCFNNRYKKMIYNLIKTPCTKMNNTVGDGTTTAIALTNAIFNRYMKRKDEINTLYRLPRKLTSTWESVTAELIEKIKMQAKPIDPKDYDTIYHLAYVSSNGDHEISDAIAKVYQQAEAPNIKMKSSPTNKSYISQVNGFEFPASAIDVAYVRNQDLTAVEKDVKVLILDHCVETDEFKGLIIKLNDVYRSMKCKLIIIAPEYDKYMCESVLGQYVNYEMQKYKTLNLILTQYRISDLAPSQREDLATVLKGKIVTKDMASNLIETLKNSNEDKVVEDMNDSTNEFYRYVGCAEEVLLSCRNGSIYNPFKDIVDDPLYKQALTRATAELDDIIAHTDAEKQSFAAKVYEAQGRLLQLQMKNFIYYIGADSELKKQIVEAAVEDVIKCLRSAVKYGVIPGCQITVARCAQEMMNEILDKGGIETLTDDEKLKYSILNIIFYAVRDVYRMILHGPENLGMVKTLPNWEFTKEDEVKDLIKQADDKATKIIDESFNKNQVFDMESLNYSDNIITSAETDTMVLMAASELIKILISGNQCIFLDAEINNSHQDEMDAYV